MPQKTTTDLIVHHTERHLAATEPTACCQSGSTWQALTLFTLAGLLVLTGVLQLVRLATPVATPAAEQAFVATDARDYLAQESFYTGEKLHAAATAEPTEAMHAAAAKVHAAAFATTLSQYLLICGAVGVLAVILYLHERHAWLSLTRPDFQIRRIRR